MSAEQIADRLVVAHHFLSLEGSGHTSEDRAVGSAQLWRDSYDSLFLHILLGEIAVDCNRDISSLSFHRVGDNSEVVS